MNLSLTHEVGHFNAVVSGSKGIVDENKSTEGKGKQTITWRKERKSQEIYSRERAKKKQSRERCNKYEKLQKACVSGRTNNKLS